MDDRFTKADFEHLRLLSLAMSLSAERSRLGVLVRDARVACGFSRSQLAELVGVSVKKLRLIEKGLGDPRLSVLHSLFSVLGISAKYSAL